MSNQPRFFRAASAGHSDELRARVQPNSLDRRGMGSENAAASGAAFVAEAKTGSTNAGATPDTIGGHGPPAKAGDGGATPDTIGGHGPPAKAGDAGATPDTIGGHGPPAKAGDGGATPDTIGGHGPPAKAGDGGATPDTIGGHGPPG